MAYLKMQEEKLIRCHKIQHFKKNKELLKFKDKLKASSHLEEDMVRLKLLVYSLVPMMLINWATFWTVDIVSPYMIKAVRHKLIKDRCFNKTSRTQRWLHLWVKLWKVRSRLSKLSNKNLEMSKREERISLPTIEKE